MLKGERQQKIIDSHTNKENLLLILFTVAVGISYIPYLGYLSFWTDEATQVLAAIGILEHGIPILPSGSLYKRAMPLSYLMALSFSILGVNEFSARIVSLIFGALIVPLTYLFGKELKDRQLGVLGAVIVAFSPWVVGWAREAWIYSPFQFFYLLTTYFFYKGYCIDAQRRYRYLAAAAFVCAMFIHELALMLIPGLLVYLLLTKGVGWVKDRDLLIGATIVGLGFLTRFFIVPGMKLAIYTFSAWNWVELLDVSDSYSAFVKRYPLLSLFMAIGLIVLIFGRENILLYLYTNFLVPLNLIPAASALTTGFMCARYVFHLLPIFVLASSLTLLKFSGHISKSMAAHFSKITNRSSTKKIEKSIFLVILLTLVLPIITSLYTSILIPEPYLQTSVMETYSFYSESHPAPRVTDGPEEHADFNEACEYVREHYRVGDAITSTNPVVVCYYLRDLITKNDIPVYHLRQYKLPFMHRRNGNVVGSSGAILLDNSNKVKSVFKESKRVWLIADHHFNPDLLDQTVITWIIENTKLAYITNDGRIRVFLSS